MRKLKLIDVFSIASGAMISSGLFVLPGISYSLTGPSLFISYLLAGILAAIGMLSQAELVSAMPKSGGTYFYIARTFGPAVGTIFGILTWFSLSLKSSFALVGMGAFVSIVFSVNIRVIAVVLALCFITINLLGVKEAARIQIGLVMILLLILSGYVLMGISQVRIPYFEPFAPYGVKSIFTTAGFVFISYGGLLKTAAIAEDVDNPGRTIPQGMILSLVVVSFLYLLVTLVTVGIVPGETLSNSLTPITDGGSRIAGKSGGILLSVAAILAFSSTANAGIMAASRYPLALGRDSLLPSFLGKTGRRFSTPYPSILITGLFVISVLFLSLKALVKAASTVVIFTYLFSLLSVVILRESGLQNYRPQFKSPFYPWIHIVGGIGSIALLFEMGAESMLISGALALIALAIYFLYGRAKAKRQSALLYLIRRITSKQLVNRALEGELKEIIRERDKISKDRFDGIIEQCQILDIDKSVGKEKLFHLIADSLSSRLKIDKERLYELLVLREEESSTVLSPFLAIPHIIVEGERKFDVLLARCRNGVYFSEKAKDIKAIFVLIGTKDERNFHLRVLSAIAQIVLDPEFETRWLEAQGKEDLRDLVLLGKRKREET